MKRAIVLLHRYLGIALCLLVAAWCLSGIVMMYVGYPQFGSRERISSLAPLASQDCCDLVAARAAALPGPVSGFALEMQGGRPVLLLSTPEGRRRLDLGTGAVLGELDGAGALGVAREYQQVTAVQGTARYLDTLTSDQWTVSGGYARLAPLHRIALGDAEGTQLYVSAKTGEVVQRTTARERGWNYVGAVVHWLYFTPLRRHGSVWSQTVIAVSALGVLLAVAGLYLGIAQWRLRSSARHWTAHRGMALWHHLTGLLFGLLALAWIGSGLVSMNPWGLLESGHGVEEGAQLNHIELETSGALDAIARVLSAPGVCNPRERQLQQVASAPLAGVLYVVATNTGVGGIPSRRVRCDVRSLATAPLALPEVLHSLGAVRGAESPVSAELLQQADAYYYSDHNVGFSSAFRVVYAGSETLQYYLDPVSGALLARFDAASRGYRWIFNAVHRWDFSPGIRRRPLWDLLVVTLLTGVAALSLTGVVLALRRVLPD